MRYYIKRLGHQELGSVGEDGKSHRGRYMLTSMNIDILGMFPPLTTTQKNDSALIAIIPLYLNKKVYCNFVYHNDKFHNSTAKHPRNEYRLYINKGLEASTYTFKEGDIVVFKKEVIVEDSESKTSYESEEQNLYFMDLINNRDSEMYKFYNDIVNNSRINGGYGIYEGTISEFEDKVVSAKRSAAIQPVIDDAVSKRIQCEPINQLAQLFNASSFRDFVLVGYNNICAVTQTVIEWNNFNNLEAAHIKPRSHGGFFTPDNGIAMCRDIHWAFDKGFFTINDDYRIVVHDEIASTYLRSFENKQITLPTNQFFVPNKENLRYHREQVFGLFKTTGRL